MELLSARGISKFYRDTATLADDRVSISLQAGETRAVVGENGAGKSTLARVIAGLVAQDSGMVRSRGRTIRPGSVRESEAAGIGFVPQTSLLAAGLTVAENIALGREPRFLGAFLSRRRAYVEAATLAERFGFRLDPEAPVSSLSAAERRQVEIARALARGGEVLVLDEPTSILSETEAEGLFRLLRRLTESGKAVLLITHRLTEVLRVADTITVLREGRVVADMGTADADEAELAGLMARSPSGRSARRDGGAGVPKPRRGASVGQGAGATAPRLELRGVRLAPGKLPLDIGVARGEILAVTALAGNGLGRLEDYASGWLKPAGGEVLIDGSPIGARPREALRSGLLGYMPSEREGRGLCLPAAVRDNALALRRRDFGALEWLGRRRRDEAARAMVEPIGIHARPGQETASLSGGNRQRLLLARELDRPRPVLVLAEPLQGLDRASQAEAASLIRELAARGSAVLLLVSSVEEALAIADRAIALYRGELAFEGPNEGEETARSLLAAMTGGAAEAARRGRG